MGNWSTAPGQSIVFAIMKSPVRDGVGLTEIEMSSYFSVSQVFSSLLMPISGVALDYCGVRRTVIPCIVLLAGACLLMSAATSGPTVGVGIFALRLCCKSLELPFKAIVNYHWSAAPGKAMALVSILGGIA